MGQLIILNQYTFIQMSFLAYIDASNYINSYYKCYIIFIYIYNTPHVLLRLPESGSSGSPSALPSVEPSSIMLGDLSWTVGAVWMKEEQ